MNLYCQICCRNFTIKKIYYDINSPYIEYRCHCFSQFKKLGLSNFVLNNFCNNRNKNISRNNYYSVLENNNWKIIKCIHDENMNYYNCDCNGPKTKFCIDCRKFICVSCKDAHSYHSTFYYEQDIHINRRHLHNLEKFCYISYFYLKKLNEDVKSKLRTIIKKKTKDLEKLDEYIINNDKITDSLFALFKLLVNNFKISHTLNNYMNLSHFFKFNPTFKFEIYKDKLKKHHLVQLLLHYFRANYLIPICSNYKLFSLIKEIKFANKKNCDPKNIDINLYSKFSIWVNQENFKKVKRGEILDSKSYDYFRNNKKGIIHNLSLPLRIMKVWPLQNKKLAIQFWNHDSLAIYTFDISKNVFFLNYMIKIEEGVRQLIQQVNSKILVLDLCGYIREITLNDKNYENKSLLHGCSYCVVLEHPKFLLMNSEGLTLLENGFEHLNEKSSDLQFTHYTFGYRLSNELVLICGDGTIQMLQIKFALIKYIFTIKYTFRNKIFKNLCVCFENVKNKLLYCQTGTHIITINLLTMQINSVYNTTHFLFYPLENESSTLMFSFFEKNNFDSKKLSKLMILDGYKDIFQISEKNYLVSTPEHFYWYSIN